jgi:chromosome segregation ATPase
MKLRVRTRVNTRLPYLIVLRTLMACIALSGCVPATSYEQANSAAEVEREGHRRAAVKLAAAEEELKLAKAEKVALLAEKKDLEARLQTEESALAQTSLDMESAKKENEQQTELVTQLRGELARVGDHLKTYQGDKDALAEELAAAEAKIKLLEEQIVYLRSKAATSEDAQSKLEGALAELSDMQKDKAAAPADEKEAPADDADAAAGDETDPGESPEEEPNEAEEPVDEVMPEEESPQE